MTTAGDITPKPPGEGEAIATQNPNLRVIRIPDAGHLPWIDDPERVVGEIERFMATQPGAA